MTIFCLKLSLRFSKQRGSGNNHFQNTALAAGMDKKQAMKEVARDRGISKRDVYQQLL